MLVVEEHFVTVGQQRLLPLLLVAVARSLRRRVLCDAFQNTARKIRKCQGIR